ncbi:hypothetical protein [Microbacterium trichothecenolyticum]|uniref:hypothetical protein n=1 Tax=Microbacterium trichothecenolyticum TaxID=69370 RepID=UPI0037C6F4B1
MHDEDGVLFITGMLRRDRSRDWMHNISADPNVIVHVKKVRRMGDSNSHFLRREWAVLPRNSAVLGMLRPRPPASSFIEIHGVSPVTVP